MRTTLTLEEDLSQALKERVRATGKSFKEVVNETIRRGLSVGEAQSASSEPFRIDAHASGFRSGVDPLRLNQLYDELELEDARQRASLKVNEP